MQFCFLPWTSDPLLSFFFVPSPALPKTAARTWLSAFAGLAKVWGSSKLTASRSRPWKIRYEQMVNDVNLDMSLWLAYLVSLNLSYYVLKIC